MWETRFAMIASPLAGKILGSAQQQFAIAEWSEAGGAPGARRYVAPWHVHHKDDEAWYVVEGRLCVLAGDEEVELPAGSAYLVPRGTPHTYWNPGSERARYLLLMTPTILRLIQALHAMKDCSRAAMAAVYERHDSSLVDPPAGY